MTDAQHGGWTLRRSIAMELDVALSIFSPERSTAGMSPDLKDSVSSVAPDWKAQWTDMLGPARHWVTVLQELALVAGVIGEEDYFRATLAMRELTLAGALERMTAMAAPYGVHPTEQLAPREQAMDLATRIVPALWRSLGLEAASEQAALRRSEVEAEQVLRVLRDGDLHARFWLWLDRFYFEFYRPWREARLPEMEARERDAMAALGAREREGVAPALDWLPVQNPVIFRPELTEAVRAGRTQLVFWSEPFGFFDFWAVHPGELVVGYGRPTTNVTEIFRAEAEGIAERAKAVSDPTRLMILRIIRTFGMDNTQMADYLGIARPTVSIHAKILREAGLIQTRQEGRAALHTLNPGAIRQLFRDLEQFLQLSESEGD